MENIDGEATWKSQSGPVASKSVRHPVITYSCTIKACSNCSLWQLGVQLLRLMKERDVPPDTICFNSALSSRGSRAEPLLPPKEDFNSSWWQRSVSLLDAMVVAGRAGPDAVSFSTTVLHCDEASAWSSAVALLRCARPLRVKPDLRADEAWRWALQLVAWLNQIICSCKSSEPWHVALELLSILRIARVAMDPSVWAGSDAMLSSLERGHWQAALLMRTSTATHSPDPAVPWGAALGLLSGIRASRAHPTEHSFNAAISACEASAHWQLASQLLAMMASFVAIPGTISYNATISVCEKAWRWEYALHLFSQMESVQVFRDVITYSAAISACANGAQWFPSLALLAQMEHQEVLPTDFTYNALITACGRAGHWELALWFLHRQSVDQMPLEVISYNAAISACQKASQWAKGLYLLACMTLLEVEPNEISFTAAVSACEQACRDAAPD
ncbi:unnamed protein product [Symbiodinium natans]|uniref:Pentatricopeptide repeat-containing protein, chloroplastic n=1 Tax=Symbiodinium natans TaxID=878477 RepID=A0A812M2V7_9DINO|nr:unnamed protein product [Symbiodinium natans]